MRLLFGKIFGNSPFFFIIPWFFTELLSCQNFVDKKFLPTLLMTISLLSIPSLLMIYRAIPIAMKQLILLNENENEKRLLYLRKNTFPIQTNIRKIVTAMIDMIVVLLIMMTISIYLLMI